MRSAATCFFFILTVFSKISIKDVFIISALCSANITRKRKKCLVFTAETNNPDVLQKVLNLEYFPFYQGVTDSDRPIFNSTRILGILILARHKCGGINFNQ